MQYSNELEGERKGGGVERGEGRRGRKEQRGPGGGGGGRRSSEHRSRSPLPAGACAVPSLCLAARRREKIEEGRKRERKWKEEMRNI
jgi:hypothetical protein